MTIQPSDAYIAFLNQAVRICWNSTREGFGEITLYLDAANRLHIDSEYMSREFVLQTLKLLVDNAEMDN